MKTLRKESLIVLLAAFVMPMAQAEENTLTEAEKAEGWTLLFDGKNAGEHFREYKKEGAPEGWVAENGALCRTGKGDLITKEKYESFEFQTDWKISEGGNSGIMFKVLETDGPPYKTGPEAQIQDDVVLKDPQKSGWMYGLYAADKETTNAVGEWNHFVLKCRKTPTGTYKCEHWMNGEKYVEYEIGSEDWKEKVAASKFKKWEQFGTADAGHIALQDHNSAVCFKNIKIKVLEGME